jgi:hypothetical protein
MGLWVLMKKKKKTEKIVEQGIWMINMRERVRR